MGVYELGVEGIGISNMISVIIGYALLLLYTNYLTTDIRQAINWPDKRAMEGISPFLAIALPSALVNSLELFSWEIMTIMTGWMSVTKQAA